MKRLWLLPALALTACSSTCGGGPTEPPTRYISKTADMVVEIPDLGALAKRRAQIVGRLEGIATKEQIEAAVIEAKRLLTFDPTTAEGLQAAGLPASGPAAVEVLDRGRGALWVVPVGKKDKLEATVAELVKSRIRPEKSRTETAEGATITVHTTAFGPDDAIVCAHTISHGFLFLGLGAKGLDAVKGALARKKEDSIEVHPERAPLVASLGDVLVRALVPSGKEMAAQLAGMLDVPDAALARSVTSVGWGLALDDRSVAVLLRMRFDEAGQKTIGKVLPPRKATPAGVLAVSSPDAVLTLVAAGDPNALLAELAPAGSESAARLDGAFAALKDEMGVDVRTQILAHVSGHGALAMGIADVSRLTNVREFMMNPARALWSTGALGLENPDAVKQLSVFGTAADPQLEARGLVRSTRAIKERQVSVLSMKTPREGQDAVLMETWVSGGAWSFSNAAARTELMIDAEGKGADALGTRSGLVLTVNVPPVQKALRSLDVAQLAGGGAEAMLVQGFVSKALGILDKLERAELRVEPTTDGVSAGLRVVFAAAQ